YTIELNTTPDFTSKPITYTSLDDNQTVFLVSGLQPSTTYYARVKTDISTTFGPVRSFTTREAVEQLRLWGTTLYGGVNAGGTIFSFSLNDMKFTKHVDSQF